MVERNEQMRVLVVEDEDMIAEFLSMGLSYEGFAVTVATDGNGVLLSRSDNTAAVPSRDPTANEIATASHLPAGQIIRYVNYFSPRTVSILVQVPGNDVVQLTFSLATADAARSGGSGAGLGLAIAQALTQAHGGSLSVTSTPGNGATFTLSLPLAHE